MKKRYKIRIDLNEFPEEWREQYSLVVPKPYIIKKSGFKSIRDCLKWIKNHPRYEDIRSFETFFKIFDEVGAMWIYYPWNGQEIESPILIDRFDLFKVFNKNGITTYKVYNPNEFGFTFEELEN